MAVRDTLNKIEELVASASHFPLTKKAIIDEENLLQLIDEFRNELPQELGHAEEIIREREGIIRAAQHDADRIIKQAEKRATQLVDENDVVTKSREKARIIEIQAQQQAAKILEQSRTQARQFQEGVNTYSNQVFDQLIANVANTANSINDMENIMKKYLPDDMVKTVEPTCNDEEDEIFLLPQEILSIDELDCEAGIDYCGDAQDYLAALEVYEASAKNKINEIEIIL